MNRVKEAFISFNYYVSKFFLGVMTLILFAVFILSCIFRFPKDTCSTVLLDNPLDQAIGLLIFAACVFLLGLLISKTTQIVSFFDWIIVAIFGILWVVGTIVFLNGAKEQPGSDAYCCYVLAKAFINGDYGAVVPVDSYLSLWPFQTGFILYLEKMMRLFQNDDPLFFQHINAFFCLLGMLSGFGLLKEYTKNTYAKAAYILLSFSDCILPLECVSVYGNIPCFSLVIFSVWMFTKLFKGKFNLLYAFMGVAAMILACTLKGNGKIYAVALLIIGIIYIIDRKFARGGVLLSVILVSVLISFYSTDITSKYYENIAGNTLGKGVPAIAYIAMGLQGSGGWNGFHSNTYMQTGYDYAKTVDISKASLMESFSEYKEHPAKALKLFYYKTLHQYVYESRGAFWDVNCIWKEPRTEFAISAVSGSLSDKINHVANIRHSILYLCEFLGSLFFFLQLKKNEYSKEDYLLLTPVMFIGGYLFSLIWESHTGYSTMYVNALLPLTLAYLADRVKKNTCFK